MSFPNQLSLLRIILSPVFFYLFLSDNIVYRKMSLIVFLIAAITDWYDGWHARKFGSVSNAGIFLDPLADKILTSLTFIAFYFIKIIPLWMVVAIVVRDITITVFRSYQEYKGKTLRTSFMAKTKTFVQMTYMFILVLIICAANFDIDERLKSMINIYLYSDVNYVMMLLITILTVYTGVTYFFENNAKVEVE